MRGNETYTSTGLDFAMKQIDEGEKSSNERMDDWGIPTDDLHRTALCTQNIDVWSEVRHEVSGRSGMGKTPASPGNLKGSCRAIAKV